MSKCKCNLRARIASDMARNNGKEGCCCSDVCATPIFKDPSVLGIMAPLIYDEIGINLCAEVALGVDIPTTYPTVTNATLKVINATYTYGTDNVTVEALVGRPNCYLVTLSNITVQFAVNLYDASCRLVDTIYPTAVYLPSDTTASTADEDTNPTAVELEIFAPYGISYTAGATPTPVINFIGFNEDNNTIQQGINLFAMGTLIRFDAADSSATIGITLVLQSVYYAGYKVNSAGKIDIPKGSIMANEDSDCMRFVAGDLLNLEIKPLDLGDPSYEEDLKQDCSQNSCGNNCGKLCNGLDPTCTNGSVGDTVPITEAP